MPAAKDSEWIRKAKDGDESAFEQLVLEYYARIYRMALGMLSNPQDAEDCAQETFLKIFRSLHTYNGKASFYTWAYRIGMNTCYDYLRKNRSGNELSLDRPFGETETPLSRNLMDPDPSPEEQTERRWTAEAVRACILELPPRSARIVWLRDIEDMPYARIAEIEGIREGTVKSRLFRGRAQLGKLLEDKELFT